MKYLRTVFFISILVLALFATRLNDNSFSATVRDMARQRVQSGDVNAAAPVPGSQTNNPQTTPESLYRTRIRQPQTGAYRGRQYSGASAREMSERSRRYNTVSRRQYVPSSTGTTSSSFQKYKVVLAPVGVTELETLLNQAAARGYSLVTTLGSKLIFVRQ